MVKSLRNRQRTAPAESTSTRSARPLSESCEAALGAIARNCGAVLKRQAGKAAGGDADAVHRMRIALTRFRTAVRFFAPAVDAVTWKALADEAAWLMRQSGTARDIDVALARDERKPASAALVKDWRNERDRLYGELRQAIASPRYQALIDALETRSARGEQSEPHLVAFSERRLDRWRRKLIKHGRKLERLGHQKRHALRKRAKRFRYALEWSAPLLALAHPGLRKEIKQTQAIQNALGRTNDAATHELHASALGLEPLPAMVRLGRQKSQKRAMKRANRAFEQLGRLHSAAHRAIRPRAAAATAASRIAV